MNLYNKIFIGLIVGAVGGVVCNFWFPDAQLLLVVQKYLSDPVGKIFLNLLIMMVIPLVFASLSLGVAQIGDLKKLGRIGLKTISYFLVVTAIAVVIGLVLVNLIRPGDYLPSETKSKLLASYQEQANQIKSETEKTEFGIQTLVNIVPRNPFYSIAKPNPDMLALIFVSLIIGVALTIIAKEKSGPLIKILEGINDVTITVIHFAMKIAPFGVAALLFSITSRFGFHLLIALGFYVITVLVGLTIHLFVVYPVLLKTFARYNPVKFFIKTKAVMLTAFSTSSSSATLPTTITVSQENLGVPSQITGFVLPLGATMNMNGTALFEGITVLFLAQAFGVNLTVGVQIIVIIMSVITAIGAAGVPSGSIPLLVLVLAMVNVPVEGIAIILGVDRILDMCRTVLNVTGDVTCAAYVSRSEGYKLIE